MKNYILKATCEDKPGIISTLTGAITENDGNIIELDQFTDIDTKKFFFRSAFSLKEQKLDALNEILESIKEIFSMELTLKDEEEKSRILILCSKPPHCLIHLLEKKRQAAFPVEVPAIVSNHTDCENIAECNNIPFFHLPITPETKKEQEAAIEKIIEEQHIDYIVLARYMQILSPEFCERYSGRIINIHHSFLPGFKGANPYRQAHERGVKIIGATSHFVTSDLDEGPIICQETIRVKHHHSVKELTRFGSDIESLVLARALKKVTENKVFIDGKKTVVFN